MMSVDRKTAAPDFDQSGYPGQGEIIGPAWQTAWDLLADGQEMTARELCPLMCLTSGAKSITARNLLTSARAAGLLRARYKVIDSRRRAIYRRNPTVEALLTASVVIDCHSVPCAAMTTTPALPPETACQRLTPPTRWHDAGDVLSVALWPSEGLEAVSPTGYPSTTPATSSGRTVAWIHPCPERLVRASIGTGSSAPQ